jgi:restriction system protein
MGIVVAIAYPIVRRYWRGLHRQALIQKAQITIEQHKSSLVRRKAQLVLQDAYGKRQMEKWEKEVDYFMTNHIQPSLAPSENAEFIRDRAMIVSLIENHVEAAMQNQPAFQVFADDMTPSEFETFCAEELRRVGWDARVTMQSRDQGVDVVAEKLGVRVVLQCKLYAKPVGNKAVQEVAAGKVHERAHHGVVVTNNRYTPSAEQLASTNEVLLLHYRDLRELDNLLKAVSSR